MSSTSPPSFARLMVSGVLRMLIFLALLFVLAGRLDYWQGWVLIGLMLGFAAVAIVLFRDRPDLARERMKPGPGMKSWDKVFYAVYFPLVIVAFAGGALDGGRFAWSTVPVWLYASSLALFLGSYVLSLWAMRVNRFFSSVVRIQEDRGQHVIQTGPYAIVRHPGYVAGFFIGPTMPLLLGSLWGALPGLGASVALVVRTHLEDRTLQRELPGYAEYTTKVRYRLVPGLW